MCITEVSYMIHVGVVRLVNDERDGHTKLPLAKGWIIADLVYYNLTVVNKYHSHCPTRFDICMDSLSNALVLLRLFETTVPFTVVLGAWALGNE